MGADERHTEDESNVQVKIPQDVPEGTSSGDTPREGSTIDEFDANLPETVTLLRGSNGSKLYLVGTTHFSAESHDDVSKVIQRVCPHIVVVELCQSRSVILNMDEKTIAEEALNLSFATMRRMIKEAGFVRGMLNILMLNVSAQLTRDLGMAPGGEFRRAYEECGKVPRNPPCLFHFGDRPIQVTLHRAINELSWFRRLQLTVALLRKPDVTKEDMEKLKQRDLLESILCDLTTDYPELGRVFIEERDVYLTYSLQLASSLNFVNCSNNIEPTIAVGVVGMGHTPGIQSLWGKVTEDDIRPLMAVGNKKPSVINLRRCIGLALLAYVGFKVGKRFPQIWTTPSRFFSSYIKG